ncbi:prolyl oligopeptidase family serine peptidase [Corynebacterium tapiri]|uniref:S9 family peptidase n=1 Tax=Corynebacterium tapiri TaxID=1448266 RepID=A0A5C4U428_9CORY|nr:prolyl oligopeptidase family serine peptidase [Corynebacterium tapiri]TNL97330.1 S9 family peptidase [Corynebacterium tapiri]
MARHDIDPVVLETIDNPEALSWAHEWSQATETARDHSLLSAQLLEALNAQDRIPYVSRRGDYLYNFWRDSTHPRGLWRRTTLESYTADDPQWDVLLDIDALAQDEAEDWVFKGVSLRRPNADRALVRLSRGGADAVVVREYDVEKRCFLPEGFVLPEAKTEISWAGEDSVLVGTDLGEDSLTSSGYPRQVRLWHRGDRVDNSEVLATASRDDVLIAGDYDHQSGRVSVVRLLDFYSTRYSVSSGGGMTQLALPEDCHATIDGEQLFIEPRTEFAGVPAGGLGVMRIDDFLAGQRDFRVVFRPSESTALRGLSLTRNYLVLTVLDTVRTRVLFVSRDVPSKPATPLALPDMLTATVVATDDDSDELWISASSFAVAPTLYRVDLSTSLQPEPIKAMPKRFDDRGVETRQHWAVSADGTRIPYFITGRFEGKRPTLVGGYGGFEVSLTPSYSPVQGLAWLERGGYLVQPNLRGGGEFGPQWHSQVTGRNRHKVWEDHEAVLRDVQSRGYADAHQTGIRGGSNGGLLTSGAVTRYPELLGAVVVNVPLTDMLRYHTWSAGASWMAEYGDPDDPQDRAAIEKWSPLHNVSSAQAYPPTLVTTSTRDDRVHPAHARLFAHALSAAGQPVDYYENSVGGHAGASDNEQIAHVEALTFEWLWHHLG